MISQIKNYLTSLLMPEPYINSGDELFGKVVIVTGASKGIGMATAKLLSKKGAKLVLVSRKQSQFSPNGDLVQIQADITKEADCYKIVEKTMKKFGRIDCLINNAGIFIDKPVEKTTLVEFQNILNTNLIGPFNLSRHVVPIMRKQKNGLIINIGSKISHNTNVAPNKVSYATSKYALEGFSFSLNKELKGSGIRVTCLMPGTVSTFLSKQGRKYLSPFEVASLIKMVIEHRNVDFESIVFKSKKQNI